MHDLVRVYAVELVASDEREVAIRRLASWSVHSTLNARLMLEPFPPLIEPDNPLRTVTPATFENDDQAIRWLEAEQRNLIAVVHSAAEFDLHEVVYHLVFALTTFLHLRHATEQAMELQRLALQAALASGDEVAEALARSQLGISYGRLGDYERALDSLRRSQELFAAAGHGAGECLAAGNRGLTARRAGRPIEALEHHGRALELAREGGDENEVGCLLNNLAMVYLDLGRPAGAEYAAREAVEIHRRTNDRYLEACAVDTVGLACAAQHKHTEAVNWFRESCRLCQELGDQWSEAISLRSLGVSLLVLGDYDAARTAVHRASAILDELAAADTASLSRSDLADLLSAIPDP